MQFSSATRSKLRCLCLDSAPDAGSWSRSYQPQARLGPKSKTGDAKTKEARLETSSSSKWGGQKVAGSRRHIRGTVSRMVVKPGSRAKRRIRKGRCVWTSPTWSKPVLKIASHFQNWSASGLYGGTWAYELFRCILVIPQNRDGGGWLGKDDIHNTKWYLLL